MERTDRTGSTSLSGVAGRAHDSARSGHLRRIRASGRLSEAGPRQGERSDQGETLHTLVNARMEELRRALHTAEDAWWKSTTC